VDAEDPKARYAAGRIGLYLGGNRAATVRVRRLQIKEMPPGGPEKDREPGTVPLTPQKSLEHMAGNWAVAVTEPRRPAAPARYSGRLHAMPVAGGKFLRSRMRTEGGGPDELLVIGFDPDRWEYVSRYFNARGEAVGPATGRFDAATRTATVVAQPDDGVALVLNTRYPDPDTILSDLVARDRDGKVVQESHTRMTRDPTGPPFGEGPDADRPPEMAVLDRLVGTWETEMASRVRPGEKWRVELIGRKVLGGRFVETFERVLPSGDEHYTIYTYDPKRGAYRSWYFSSRWAAAEGTGTWDEAAKSLTWSCHGGGQHTALKWTFAAPDRIEFGLTVTDRSQGGKVVEGIDGTHTRKAK
jgi:hypothetical protein